MQAAMLGEQVVGLEAYLVAQLHPAGSREQIKKITGKALVLALRIDAVVRRKGQFLYTDHITFSANRAGTDNGEKTADVRGLHSKPPV
jgi:hypothetical protein